MTEQTLFAAIRANACASLPRNGWRVPAMIVALIATMMSVAAPLAKAQGTAETGITLPDSLGPDAGHRDPGNGAHFGDANARQ